MALLGQKGHEDVNPLTFTTKRAGDQRMGFHAFGEHCSCSLSLYGGHLPSTGQKSAETRCYYPVGTGCTHLTSSEMI